MIVLSPDEGKFKAEQVLNLKMGRARGCRAQGPELGRGAQNLRRVETGARGPGEQRRGAQRPRVVGTEARILAPKRAVLKLVPRSQAHYSGPQVEDPAREKGWRLIRAKPQQRSNDTVISTWHGPGWRKGQSHTVHS